MADSDDRVSITVDMITARAGAACFGKPLVTNVHRGLVAEVIVEAALPLSWNWCGADYAGHDFEHADGTRLEVKQSAALQSWAVPGNAPSKGLFDIASRMGRWDGALWVAEPGRRAHVYVLAHHPVVDETADHRNPAQWRFHIIATTDLPATKRLSLSGARKLVPACGFAELGEAVERVRQGLA